MQISSNSGIVLLVIHINAIEYYVAIKKSEEDAYVLIWNVLQDILFKQGAK